ncbi:MAG: response regulator [Bacteriovoracaceae bacterium]
MNDNHAPKILIVDDEAQLRKLLTLTLEANGYKVVEARNGQEAVSFAATHRPELIILDLGLPDIKGQEALRLIREWSEIPVIILSVQDDSETIVEALTAGADDYMTKPFDANELMARVKVCLRRSLKKDHEQTVFEIKHLKVDLASRLVFKNNEEIKLTSTEYDLLKYFIKNTNKVLTNRQILKEVWGPGSVEQAQYPRVYVRYLRAKIENDPNRPELILTEPGVGYRLKK